MCQSLKKVSCLSLRHSQECLRQDFEVLRASQGPLLNKPSLPVVPSLTGVLTKLPLRVRTPGPPPQRRTLVPFFCRKKGTLCSTLGGSLGPPDSGGTPPRRGGAPQLASGARKKGTSSSQKQVRVEPRPAPPRRGPPALFRREKKKGRSSSQGHFRVEPRPAPPRRAPPARFRREKKRDMKIAGTSPS